MPAKRTYTTRLPQLVPRRGGNAQPTLPVLPRDLIDSIIDHLADEKIALKACSLVSWAFAFSSRRHLFRRLHFDLGNGIDRRLAILSSCPPSHLSLAQSLSIGMLDTSLTFDHRLVVNTLKLLTNLNRITIQCIWDQGFDVVDDSGISRADILRELCRPTITHFTIIGSFVFPPDHFHRLTSLRHLSLRNVAFLPSHTNTDSGSRTSIKLLYLGPYSLLLHEHQTSVLATRYLQRPSCPWDFRQLESLGFHAVELYEYDAFLQFMKKFSPLHVSSLAVQVPLNVIESKNSSFIDFSIMPDLSCLTLMVNNTIYDRSHTPWVVSQLRMIPMTNELRQLHLWLFSDNDDAITSRKEDWAVLDECLAREQFDRLESVDIRLRADTDHHRQLVQHVEDMLPRTMGRKQLRVSVSESIFLDANFPILSR